MRLGVEAALLRGELVPGDVKIHDGLVVEVGAPRSASARGIAVPGFVDLQVNGFGGIDFLSASTCDYRTAGERLLEHGVTAYQPTFITAPEETLLAALRELPVGQTAPRILGAHLEGPFLSCERLGTHPIEHRRDPDVSFLDRLLDTGSVAQMTVAPELRGADAVVERLLDRQVVVAAGHTDATAAEAHRAFDLGVSVVTHAFNAMRPLRSRDPGILGVALTRPDVFVQLIVDGHHLAPETVRLAWAAAAGRLALVSDATAAAAADGNAFQLGEVPIEVAGGVPVRADGVLAGTTLSMIDAVRNLHALGVPLADAVGAATCVPARIARRSDIGRLEPAFPADVVVLDDRLEITRVLCAGDTRVAA